MYVFERNQAMWLCASAIETFEVQAVQIRLQGEYKDFKVFEQRLDNWEHIDTGVIQIYKCSDTTTKCKDCHKCKDCEIRQRVRDTAQASAEFARWVDENDGYMLY
jgi:hypothetical protein